MPFGIARTNFRQRFVIGENAKTPLWVAAVVAAGGTVSAARRTLVDNLYNSLDSLSLTSNLNRLWLLAAENTGAASVDLIARVQYTLVNSPTFTTDQGYAGNGTSSYINLNTTNAGTQNACTFGMANRTAQANASVVSMGSSNATDQGCNIYLAFSDGKCYFDNNDNNSDAGRTAPATKTGIFINSRTSSSLVTLYQGGTSFATQAVTSTGVATQNYCLGAVLSPATVAESFCANQFSACFLGNTGFNATQASNFNTTLQTYLTAVGA